MLSRSSTASGFALLIVEVLAVSIVASIGWEIGKKLWHLM